MTMNYRIKKKIGKTLTYLAVLFVIIWTLLPIIWMFLSSLTTESELLNTGKIIPSTLSFDRYASILFPGTDVSGTDATIAFRYAIVNSCIVAGATTLISLIFGSLASYCFARMRFFGKKPLLYTVMFFQLLPPIAMIIPYYLTMSRLGMLDNVLTLIIINTNFVLAYVIWVLNGYFKTIPVELEEAARIDGCSWFQIYYKIIVPATTPGFVAVGILSFLMAWDEFLYALIFTKSPTSKTITVAISQFGTKYGIDYGMMMTAGVLATIIPLVLAMSFQKYIVTGLTAGSVKG